MPPASDKFLKTLLGSETAKFVVENLRDHVVIVRSLEDWMIILAGELITRVPTIRLLLTMNPERKAYALAATGFGNTSFIEWIQTRSCF